MLHHFGTRSGEMWFDTGTLPHLITTFRIKWGRKLNALGCGKSTMVWRTHHMHHKKSYGREHRR